MTGPLPTLHWCRSLLHNGYVRLNRGQWKITNAFVVAPGAPGRSKPDAALDIAVVVEIRDGLPPLLTAPQLSEMYYSRFEIPEQLPKWQGRPIRFRFFYPEDAALAKTRRIELPLK